MPERSFVASAFLCLVLRIAENAGFSCQVNEAKQFCHLITRTYVCMCSVHPKITTFVAFTSMEITHAPIPTHRHMNTVRHLAFSYDLTLMELEKFFNEIADVKLTESRKWFSYIPKDICMAHRCIECGGVFNSYKDLLCLR